MLDGEKIPGTPGTFSPPFLHFCQRGLTRFRPGPFSASPFSASVRFRPRWCVDSGSSRFVHGTLLQPPAFAARPRRTEQVLLQASESEEDRPPPGGVSSRVRLVTP